MPHKRHYDSAPVGHTCPDIDKAIKFIRGAMDYLDGLKFENRADERERDGNVVDLDKAIDLLEELRESNDTLRDWGADGEQRVEELTATVDDLEKQVEDLQSDLESVGEGMAA